MKHMSSFSGESFDCCKWVNEALAKRGPEESVEDFSSSLLLQVQMQQLDLASKIEEASFDAAGAIPRILRELSKIREDSEDLRVRLGALESSLGGIEASTDRNVALLVELDRVKANMELCGKTLRQAERFLALSKQLEAAQLSDFGAIVAQIREVRSSLHVLQNVPEFKNATAKLSHFERRLESHVRPKFVAALRNNDVNAAMEMVGVYSDIGQEAAMHAAYCECRVEDAFGQLSQDQQAVDGGSVVEWLQQIYTRCRALVSAEAEWCSRLFGRTNRRAGQLRLAAQAFSHWFRPVSHRAEQCKLPDLVKMVALARETIVALDGDDAVATAVMRPFVPLIATYGQREKDFLQSKEMAASIASDPYAVAEEAAERCQALSDMGQWEGLVSALESVLCPLFRHRPSAAASTTSDRWSHIRSALRQLASARSAQRRLAALDSRLRAHLLASNAGSSLEGAQRFKEDASAAVLAQCEREAQNAVETCRGEVFDSIFGPVKNALNDYARAPIWQKGGSPNAEDNDPDLPRLRPEPSAGVTAVVDHLFALPHHLEHMSDSGDEDGVDYWINRVAKSAAELFTKQVQTLPQKMTPTAALQLQTDIDALSNLFSALGVQGKTGLPSIKK